MWPFGSSTTSSSLRNSLRCLLFLVCVLGTAGCALRAEAGLREPVAALGVASVDSGHSSHRRTVLRRVGSIGPLDLPSGQPRAPTFAELRGLRREISKLEGRLMSVVEGVEIVRRANLYALAPYLRQRESRELLEVGVNRCRTFGRVLARALGDLSPIVSDGYERFGRRSDELQLWLSTVNSYDRGQLPEETQDLLNHAYAIAIRVEQVVKQYIAYANANAQACPLTVDLS